MQVTVDQRFLSVKKRFFSFAASIFNASLFQSFSLHREALLRNRLSHGQRKGL
jgi:hypothetical protein